MRRYWLGRAICGGTARPRYDIRNAPGFKSLAAARVHAGVVELADTMGLSPIETQSRAGPSPAPGISERRVERGMPAMATKKPLKTR